MWLTRTAIAQPLLTAVLFIALAIFGLTSYLKLGASLNPNASFPVVVVAANYPGASPEEMERLVVKPLEDQIDGIDRLDQVTATMQDGVAWVAVQFKLDTNLDFAAIDVQRRVDAARPYMPSDIDPPRVHKNGVDAVMLTYGVSSMTMTANAVTDLVINRVVPEIRQLPDISGVDAFGAQRPEFQVRADPARLRAAGAMLDDLFNSVSVNNVNVPGGRIDSPTEERNARIRSDVRDAADIAGLPIATSSNAGRFLHVGSVADVIATHADQRQTSRFNGRPGLLLYINRTITSDDLRTTARTRAAMRDISARYPALAFTETGATAQYTKAALDGVMQTLVEGIALTALVLLLFLHAWRSALVVMASIPSSLLATFIVMRMARFDLDFISLMGLSLTIGILVDDSIVVIENIMRHRDLGAGAIQAAVAGRSEIGGAAIAITLVDVVVFLPMAFISGLVGKFTLEFGVVVVVATLFSLLVSFTLTPLLAATWAFQRHSEVSPRALTVFQTAFEQTVAYYRLRALPAALRHRWTTVAVCAALVVNSIALLGGGPLRLMAAADVVVALLFAAVAAGLTVAALRRGEKTALRAPSLVVAVLFGIGGAMFALDLTNRGVQTEFVPQDRNGDISMALTYQVGTPIATTEASVKRLENVILSAPEIAFVESTVGIKPGGFSSTIGGHVARLHVSLKDTAWRATPEVIQRFRRLATLVPGARLEVAESDSAPIFYTLTGPDDAMSAAAEKFASYIRTIPGTTNVQTSNDVAGRETIVHIDRARCEALGVSPAAVAFVARISLGGAVATKIRTATGLVDVRVQLNEAVRRDDATLRNARIRTMDGGEVSLADVASFETVVAPLKIEHKNRARVLRVTAGIDSRRTRLGAVIARINTALQTPGFLPNGVQLTTNGQTKYFGETLSSLGSALAISIVLVYMLMVVLYRSLVRPFIVMFSIPVALIGAAFGLAVTGQTLNMYSILGLIMLLGLVAKNGILLVDYAGMLSRRGMRATEAMIEAGATRLRPIVMTTAAMAFGMLPLALGFSAGAESRRSLGVVLIGGLLSSLFLTLFLVPVVYTWLVGSIERRADQSALAREFDSTPAEPVAAS